MKVTAGCALGVVVIAFGLFPGAIGELLQREHAEHIPTGGEETNALDDSLLRRLQPGTDDALDINGTPAERAANALMERTDWAETEFLASEGVFHENLGDFSSAATFHKSLPHDELGQVSSLDFDELIGCVASGDFDTCQEVPAGSDEGFLVNPLGGLATDMAGAAGHAITIPAAPALNSENLAAQIAEVYWMALTRDVPFSQYGEDDATVEAADNLATMPGFADLNFVAVGPDGRADPLTQLFRSSAVGVEIGPHVSQLLVQNFTIDSIEVEPKQNTFAPGEDYMADFDEWLSIQNGDFPVEPEILDPVPRFIRNGRDLSTMAATDTINTEAYRSALILIGQGAISAMGFNGPYVESGRQTGFVNYGVSHSMRLVGTGELSMRSSWYQKWNVHLFARPEAIGGTIHNILNGDLEVEFADSIINNDLLFRKVAARNREITGQRFRRPRTFLLPQTVREGSPTHPSYPSGHAVQNGAYSTLLKALVGLERGLECFNDPMVPSDDGLTLLPYTGDCLTFEGEINKYAANVALGRNWMGVHWRMDAQEGLLLGETVAVRILQQEVAGFPEEEPYEFRLMSGQVIRLEPDGSFFVDNVQCSGEAFEGADLCT